MTTNKKTKKTLGKLIFVIILVVAVFFAAYSQLKDKPLDAYLTPQPAYGGLENQNHSSGGQATQVECYTSNDCPYNKFCSGQQCYPINCPDGYIEDHMCKQYECTYNSDCDSNKLCLNRKCDLLACQSGHAIDHTCKQCLDSVECNGDEYCNMNSCAKVSCYDGYIQNHACIKYQCTYDRQCSDSEVCDSRFCKQVSCSSGQVVSNHTCKQVTGLYTKAQTYIQPFSTSVTTKLQELTDGKYNESHFGVNFDNIYYYATSISYVSDQAKWGVPDYWQTPEETITSGTGDCEDHAILLQSLIEALFYKTYGYIPNETVYMVCGCIDFGYDGTEDGCHCWNMIREDKLPQNHFAMFDSKRTTAATKNVILNDVTVNGTKMQEKTTTYDISKDKQKTGILMSVIWQGRTWVELESTWGMPLSYYESVAYPYTSVWEAFNSMEYYDYPDFIRQGHKPTIIDDINAYLTDFLSMVYNIFVGWFG